jgi:hypothetical protein
MSALNSRNFVAQVEREINHANRLVASRHPAGSKAKVHPKAERFRFEKKSTRRFDPNAGPERSGNMQVA